MAQRFRESTRFSAIPYASLFSPAQGRPSDWHHLYAAVRSPCATYFRAADRGCEVSTRSSLHPLGQEGGKRVERRSKARAKCAARAPRRVCCLTIEPAAKSPVKNEILRATACRRNSRHHRRLNRWVSLAAIGWPAWPRPPAPQSPQGGAALHDRRCNCRSRVSRRSGSAHTNCGSAPASPRAVRTSSGTRPSRSCATRTGRTPGGRRIRCDDIL
jgi:hypothetical protein